MKKRLRSAAVRSQQCHVANLNRPNSRGSHHVYPFVFSPLPKDRDDIFYFHFISFHFWHSVSFHETHRPLLSLSLCFSIKSKSQPRTKAFRFTSLPPSLSLCISLSIFALVEPNPNTRESHFSIPNLVKCRAQCSSPISDLFLQNSIHSASSRVSIFFYFHGLEIHWI